MSDRSRSIIEHQTSNRIKREAGDKSGSCVFVYVCVRASNWQTCAESSSPGKGKFSSDSQFQHKCRQG